MLVLILGLVLFLGIHSVLIVMPGIRSNVIARSGVGAWMWPYVFVSIVGMVLIVVGYGLARANPVVLYYPPVEWRYVALVLMLPVFPLLIATYVPGRLRAAVRHPMLIATILWGVSHLLAGGALADIALFGGFAAWALLDLISISRRATKPRANAASPKSLRNDGVAIIGGLALYAAFIGGLHYWLFGVAPI